MVNRVKVAEQPTPQRVLNAIFVIQDYLEQCGWAQAIIYAGGGASFHLTDVYQDVTDRTNEKTAEEL